MGWMWHTPEPDSLRGSLPSKHGKSKAFMVSSQPCEACTPLEPMFMVIIQKTPSCRPLVVGR